MRPQLGQTQTFQQRSTQRLREPRVVRLVAGAGDAQRVFQAGSIRKGAHRDAARQELSRDPRGVLAEFGVTLPEQVDVRVWDSTAEVRYLVIPQRPAGTESWSEEQLAELVTRDSMIGVGLPLDPSALADAVAT